MAMAVITATAQPSKLNPTLVAGGNVTVQFISPDGNRVVYRADQDVDEVFELYSVPPGGGTAKKISGPKLE